MVNTLIISTIAAAIAVSSASAQGIATPANDSVQRLTVRPHTMATGTRTEKAGQTELDSLPGYFVYVPPKAVGTQRVPLVVLLHGGGRSASMEMEKFRPLADKYGMIILAPNAATPGRWDVIAGFQSGQTQRVANEAGLNVTAFPEADVRKIDAAMKQVLRTHAIDPDRIALLGFSDGGSYSLFLGRSNLDIFSRIAGLSALLPLDAAGPENPKTQFCLSGGIAESMVPLTLKLSQVLRQQGHPVMTLLGLRQHVDYVEDEDFVWRWLTQSWADPSITTRVASVSPDSDAILTTDVYTRMTTFWTRFMQEPDSIQVEGRMKHQEQLSLLLGTQPVSVITMDMVAMAAAYPSVAADLQAAGLTAAQEAAYRTAMLRTEFTQMGISTAEGSRRLLIGLSIPFGVVDPTSVLGKNLAFRQAHVAEFQALAQTRMWITQ